MSPARRSIIEFVAAATIFALGTALYLGPSIPSVRGHLGPDFGDPRLNLYFASWSAHEAGRGFEGLWSPPFFHPTPGVLAYSDHLIGPGLALGAMGWLGVGPVTAFNLLFLASFVLFGAVTFAVFRRLGLGAWAAMLGGWLVTFAHLRWDEVSHYQVLRAQWIPAVLYTFDRFLERPRRSSAAMFLVVYLVHVSGGTYLAYMIHVPMAVVLGLRVRAMGWRAFFGGARARWLAGVGATSIALLAPFVWGYVTQWGSRTVGRELWEVRQIGAVLSSFVEPSHGALVRSLGVFGDYAGRGALFPGFVALAGCLALVANRSAERMAGGLRAAGLVAAAGIALALWGLHLADAYTLDAQETSWLRAIGLRRYNGPRAVALAGLVLTVLAWRRMGRRVGARPGGPGTGAGSFVPALLACGAVSLWLTLPVGFTTFNRLVPGMSGIRVAHRFFVFTLLALAYLAARGWESWTSRLPRRSARAAIAGLVSLAAIAEATPRRWSWAPVPERREDFAAYARFLADSPDVAAYVELPLLADHRETERMHAQTLHWKLMVNGYSARFAESYDRLLEHCTPFPDRTGLERLREIGVTHLVVRLRNAEPAHRYVNRPLALATNEALRRGDVELVFEDPDAGDSILRLTLGGALDGGETTTGPAPPARERSLDSDIVAGDPR